jgi:hypothetical protein
MINKLILFLLIFIEFGCEYKVNYPYHSESIKDSKEKKVFIAEYKIINEEISYKNNRIKLKEAWVEHAWYYKNAFKAIERENFIYLEISTDIDCKAIDCINLDLFSNDKIKGINNFSNTSGSTIYYHFELSEIRDTFVLKLNDNQELVLISNNLQSKKELK